MERSTREEEDPALLRLNRIAESEISECGRAFLRWAMRWKRNETAGVFEIFIGPYNLTYYYAEIAC
jgi:hypothetical protein